MPYLGREPQGILANTIEGNLKVTGTISADSINDKLALNGSDTSSPQSNANDQIVLEAGTLDDATHSSVVPAMAATDNLLLEDVTPSQVEVSLASISAGGTSGQFLQSQGSLIAPAFATAASSDLVKIQSTTASGAASVDFTSSHFDNSTYSSYIFKFLNVSPGTDGQHFIARTSTDGGSTYDSSGYDRVTEERNSTGTENQNGGDAQSEVRMTSTSNWGSASNESLSGTFFLYNPGASEYTQMNFTTAYMDDQAGTYWNSLHGSGQRTSAADVDGIQFLASSGTISGIITMYGMK